MVRTFRLLTLLAGVLLAQSAFAQNPRGNIAGTVTDEQGKTVSEVYVRAHGSEQTQAFKTDTDGEYRLNDLVAGRYVLTIARDGFTTIVRGVMVKTGKTATISVVLKPAPVEPEPNTASSDLPSRNPVPVARR